MRGNTGITSPKNICCFIAVFALISSFVGCASGSCLSYGHSCWGAHGKRSGIGRLQEDVGTDGKRTLPTLDERWLLSRLINRQLMQLPIAEKLHARMLAERSPPILDEDLFTSVNDVRQSMASDKLSDSLDTKDLLKIRRKTSLQEGQHLDSLLVPQPEDFTNERDQAVRIGFYELLKNMKEKS